MRRDELSLVALALALACAHAPTTPDDALRAAMAPKASAEVIAVAALNELDRGHGAAAQELVDRLAAAPPPAGALEALARLLVCQRALDLDCEHTAALALLDAAPDAPTASLAAAALRELAGQSTRLDEQLLPELQARLAFAPEHAPSLEAQHLLRDAAAALWVARADYPAAQKLRDQGGVIQDWEIVGPLSPYHYLQFDTPLGPELAPDAGTFATEWGSEGWRPLRMNNGQLPIGHALERGDALLTEGPSRAPTGDLIYLQAKVNAAGGGLYLRLDTTASAKVFLDGKLVVTRDAFRKLVPRAQWIAIDADDGPHTLLLKIAVGDPTRSLEAEVLPQSAPGSLPLEPTAVAALLGKRLGRDLGQVLAARIAVDRDPHAALQLLDADAASGKPLGALGLATRAMIWPLLGTLDDEDARGRVEADLDSWVDRDPKSPEARVRRAQLLLDLSRFPVAQTDLEAAREAALPRVVPEILYWQARLHLARDAGALAAPLLATALATDPGYCNALDLQLSADDAQNALAHGDQIAEAFGRCPGGPQALASRRARKEGMKPLADYWRGRSMRSPGDPEAAMQLADSLLALGDNAAANAALEQRLRSWPGDLAALRHRAILEDLAAKALNPSPLWKQVLDGAPEDLGLRRALGLLAGEPPPLEDLVPSVAEALAAPRWIGPGRPPSATLLDSGAAWLHADGTITERIRTIEMPLDETALNSLGELELPPGAILIALRTHKRDGRVLDADAQINGEKHTVSAAALEVGDTLEIDYLVASPPPRRAGGNVADAFYFAASDSSLRRSVYAMRSDLPAEIDGHRIDAPHTLQGDALAERTRVAAVPEEPNSVPQNEYFPWVQLGAKNHELDLARSVGDQLLDKTVVDEGIAALVAQVPQAAVEKTDKARGAPRENADRARARALWALLSRKLRAENGSLAVPASEVVGQGNGNLILPMKAGLAALGIPSQLVLVAGPAQSQEPHRFARLSEYADMLLRVEPHGAAPFFLAATLRDAPFDAIPPNLCGSRALILPGSDQPGESTVLPQCPEHADRAQGPNDHLTQLELSVAADGAAAGHARETLFGFEATNLRQALAELDDSQRRQGVESALAAVFPAVELTDLHFELGQGPGAPLAVSYSFKVPDFATPQGSGVWSAPLRGFPAQLAQRYAQLAVRQLPLLVATGERPSLELTLHLPVGAKLDASTPTPADVRLDSPFGSYLRSEAREGGRITLREKLVLPPQRVLPDKYPDFAGFADQVDRAQTERVRYSVSEGRTERQLKASGPAASGLIALP